MHKSMWITTFEEFHQEVFNSRKGLYRGVSDISYGLIPKVGRVAAKKSVSSLLKEEKLMLEAFKNYAIPYLEFSPASDWDWLALAQHHGMPTRLLDWSRSPLIAAWFAVESDKTCDAAIYRYTGNTVIDTNLKSPLDVKGDVKRFTPRHVTRRLTAQQGQFTIHPNPLKEYNSTNILKICIAASFRRKLRKVLLSYGIHSMSLFPDLDGVSSYISIYKGHEP